MEVNLLHKREYIQGKITKSNILFWKAYFLVCFTAIVTHLLLGKIAFVIVSSNGIFICKIFDSYASFLEGKD